MAGHAAIKLAAIFHLLSCVCVNAQLANFDDLVRLAINPPNSESREDRSLANSYPFNLGERSGHHSSAKQHHHEPVAIADHRPQSFHGASSQQRGLSQDVIAARQAAILGQRQGATQQGALLGHRQSAVLEQRQAAVLGQRQATTGSLASSPAPSFNLEQGFNFGSFGSRGFSQFGNVRGQQAQHAVARGHDSLPLHASVQQHLSGQQRQLSTHQQPQLNSLQYQQEQQHQVNSLQFHHEQQSQLLRQNNHLHRQPVHHDAVPAQPAAIFHRQQAAPQPEARPFIGPAPAPAGYSRAPAPAPAPYQHEAAPVITVTDDAVIAVDAPHVGHHAAVAAVAAPVPGQCPAPHRLPHTCSGAVNTCWSIGLADVDCPGHALCCFDGCSNYCVGQAPARALASAVVIPEHHINPAQARQEIAVPVLENVAAAERCIDKIEEVEEIEYDEVEECHHSYDKKCHTTYTTEYDSQQEEECDDNYKKECEITYSPHASNVTVDVCMTPLIKDCNLAGPEVCRTEYISECWTRNDPHTVVDDVPRCRTEYEEKCELTQSGYVTDEKCSKWPREVCTISKELRSKPNPVTKCEKVPQRLCGPAGCGFVPGPEQCHQETKTVVTDIPTENCDLIPQRRCSHVTKLVPKLTPVEECVDVPKEVCQKSKGAPRVVVKPVTKKWCYVPSQESGLV